MNEKFQTKRRGNQKEIERAEKKENKCVKYVCLGIQTRDITFCKRSKEIGLEFMKNRKKKIVKRRVNLFILKLQF